MPNASAPRDTTPSDGLGLQIFRQPPAEEGLSLDKLNRAFAAMLGTGDDPYSVPADPDADPVRAAIIADDTVEPDSDAGPRTAAGGRAACDQRCEINPRSILEAMLFVGTPDNQPLAAPQIAGLMRGVRPAEIDELVRDLNANYAASNRPYQIASDGAGYRMALVDRFQSVRVKLQGRIKQARLSPAAIEVLAIVAYRQPLTADEISLQRGAASGPILSQLVRRELLQIERSPEQPRVGSYHTTDRFLKLLDIESLADLPQSLELDRQ